MKIDQARTALNTALIAAIPNGFPVIWPNRDTFDLANDQRTHLRVEFIIYASNQMSLGDVKVVRYLGVFALMVCAKEGSGIAESTALADTLCTAFQMKNLSGLQTETVRPERTDCVDGWHLFPVSVPFWFDEIVVS